MLRFATPRLAAILLLCWIVPPTGVSAQAHPGVSSTNLRLAPAAPPILRAGASAEGDDTGASLVALPSKERPDLLVPLYVSFGVLQVLDVHSTSRALDRGAVEANPLMRGLAGSRAGLLAVKAAGTAGVIYATEKMWKRNRPAAVIFMVGTNSAMLWVVQRNYRVP